MTRESYSLSAVLDGASSPLNVSTHHYSICRWPYAHSPAVAVDRVRVSLRPICMIQFGCSTDALPASSLTPNPRTLPTTSTPQKTRSPPKSSKLCSFYLFWMGLPHSHYTLATSVRISPFSFDLIYAIRVYCSRFQLQRPTKLNGNASPSIYSVHCPVGHWHCDVRIDVCPRHCNMRINWNLKFQLTSPTPCVPCAQSTFRSATLFPYMRFPVTVNCEYYVLFSLQALMRDDKLNFVLIWIKSRNVQCKCKGWTGTRAVCANIEWRMETIYTWFLI